MHHFHPIFQVTMATAHPHNKISKKYLLLSFRNHERSASYSKPFLNFVEYSTPPLPGYICRQGCILRVMVTLPLPGRRLVGNAILSLVGFYCREHEPGNSNCTVTICTSSAMQFFSLAPHKPTVTYMYSFTLRVKVRVTVRNSAQNQTCNIFCSCLAVI